jgi:hypothetical protein
MALLRLTMALDAANEDANEGAHEVLILWNSTLLVNLALY